ncbi:tRNA (adenosine(37)-N6)-threonylcarbamoyltransferase complex dimerization subunit type 1 TsaB [Kaarinaea lacus]
MKLLAIETATEACSAALLIDGDILQRYEIAPREHARRILVMVDELMAEAQLNPTQLDAIAFGRGPGSFIGVRIAAGITQGIAYSADLPVAPVSTLAALAQGSEFDQVLVAIDARMDEIYWGQFERPSGQHTVVATDEESLIRPDQLVLSTLPQTKPWYGIGTGWQAYREQLMARLPQVKLLDDPLYPAAKSVAELAVPAFEAGNMVSAEQAVPVYLRDKVAEKPAK